MKAVVVKAGGGGFSLEEIPRPSLQGNKDLILKVTTAAICGSDLHVKDGVIPGYTPGTVMGHEFVGVVEEAGQDVINFKPGDRAACPPITWCGVCNPCKRGEPQHCIRGGVFGGGEVYGKGMGGAQTSYIRVPFADNCLVHIPDGVSDEQAVMVGDVFATGYWAAKEAHIKTGDTVAVFGCGPVGFGAILSSFQFGAKRVYAVSHLDNRLAIAREYGAIAIDGKKTNVTERLREVTNGEGVDVAIEAKGYTESFIQALRSVRRGGMVSIVGLFPTPIEFPIQEMGFYGVKLSMGLGDCSDMIRLMGMVESGRINLAPLATHTFTLDKALEAYDFFEHNKDKCVKVLLKP